ncbi:DUF2075 domain-containing protein [Hyalangium gracile]|uniref:DUF2075 domain-containing protein n=1 Tax=Hyalangium gracile TaxID=394092 RepID=UPI001CCCE534|nr:DUF2075 domain-containing protein [Hyalangium gracile]
MHFYFASVARFIQDASAGHIAPALIQAYQHSEEREPSPEQQTAWKNSCAALAKALDTAELHAATIFLELRVPLCNRRCDALLVGRSPSGTPCALVIELKQWGQVSRPAGENQVVRNQAVDLHPCAQAREYAALLRYFHSAFTQKQMRIQACAYLHNLTHGPSIDVLRDKAAFGYLPTEVPLFTAGEEERLRAFLAESIGGEADLALPAWITEGTVEPSPKLLERVASVIQGIDEWTLIDEQLIAHDTILRAVDQARSTGKKAIILVRGGPGTGKSVLAIQLVGHAAQKGWSVIHASGSKAFQTVLKAKTEAFSLEWVKKNFNVKARNKLPVGHLFSTFADVATAGTKISGGIDLVVGDEAHRLWDFRRGTRFQKFRALSTTPMLEEIVSAAKVTALFLDDNQAVRASEIGHSSYILEHARRLGIEPVIIDLNAQFRCNGSAGYVEWVDHVLGYSARSTLAWYDPSEDEAEYEFRIFDSPGDVQAALQRRRSQGYKSRMVAGFCWKWSPPSPTGQVVHDIKDARFGGWSAPWIEKTGIDVRPLDNQYYKWANETSDAYFAQVGSIYSVQGFEFDYVGVIFGEDLVWTGEDWVGNLAKSKDKALTDSLRKTPHEATEKLRAVYRVLLTRGMRGTYVHFMDKASRERFESFLRKGGPSPSLPSPERRTHVQGP